MRLSAHQIDILAFDVARELIRTESVEAELDHLSSLVRRVITADLKVEDELDLEVHDLLKSMAPEMRSGQVDYAQMFEKAKKQLVRERKLVL